MAHLDLVAMREPVTCRLPTDPKDARREVRQFEDEQLAKLRRAQELQKAGDFAGADALYFELLRYAIEGITDDEINELAGQDILRIVAAAKSKVAMLEAALGNVLGDGDWSTKRENPSPDSADSNTTTLTLSASSG